MTKFERNQKRKEMRRAEAEQNQRERQKKHEKEVKELQKLNREHSKRPANYRKDQNGNIILFGNIKVSKTSGFILAAIVGVMAFLFIGSNEAFEMEGYIEREISFEECEATDFNSEMCVYYYKFCRTYDDGKSICQYAEEDPFVNVDESARFWAPEDQDFLPPTEQGNVSASVVNSNSANPDSNIEPGMFDDLFKITPNEFILPQIIQWAEAREETEPVCYTSACQKKLDAGGYDVDTADIPLEEQTKDQILKSTGDIRIERDNLEQDIIEIEKELQWYKKEINELDNDVDKAHKNLIEQEDVVKETKSDYTTFIKVSPRTQEELDERRVLVNAYENALRQYDVYNDDYDRALNIYNERQTKHFQNIYDLGILEKELELKIEELSNARIASNLAHRQYQFVNIVLSGTCLQLIENGNNTECPTYRELHQAFDNTIPVVSGEFVDEGYDIFRQPSKYQNHWKYYEQIPWYKVITVDPGVEIDKRGITIVVQPRSFDFVENMGQHDKSPSINIDLHERYIWSNIKVDKECSHAITSPDMEVIGKAVHHFLVKCNSELDNKRTIEMIPTPFLGKDSPATKYMDWIKKTTEELMAGWK